MNNETRIPFYLQIQQYFKQRIDSEQLKPHDKIPTEKELMEQFNVSRITVANALAGLANENWIYRIPGRGSFVAERKETNQEAALADGETHTLLSRSPIKPEKEIVGLILPDIGDFFAIRLIQGINKIISESEYSLFITVSNNSKEQEKSAIRQLISMGAAGLLIFPVDAETYNDEILALKVKGFPFVLLDRYLPGVETNYIGSNNKLGAELAVSHLWELGHRRIALCSNALLPTVTVEDRIDGYRKEIRRRGGAISNDLILTELAPNETESPLIKEVLENKKATAFITLQGEVCLSLMRTAKSLNLEAPRDFSVVTFDDLSPGYDNWAFITHISQSERQMGRQAAEILINLLKKTGHENTGYERNIIQPELVVRSSTGPSPVS